MTITNGKTLDGAADPTHGQPGGSGGGILISGGVTNLNDVVVTGNRTGNGGDALGGSNSFGGVGGFGGGISAAGTLTLTNCVVSNNVTGKGGTAGYSGGGGYGGGIYLSAGSVTLKSVIVAGNSTGDGGTAINPGLASGNSGYGGGIYSENTTLNMNNVTISGNTIGNVVRGSSGAGGGLFIYSGTATLTNSTVSNNHTGSGSGFLSQGGYGGGIANFGTLTVMGSTINGNITGDSDVSESGNAGGGIYNGFIIKLINSTISGNSTGSGNSNAGSSGGIFTGSVASLTNCTITGNFSFSNNGPGVFAGSNAPNVRNTVIAGNGTSGTADVSGAFNSQGHNLIGNADGATGFTGPGDQVGTSASPLNALVGALTNNGGPTLTHALLTGSPALDAGDNCVTDAAHCGDPNIPQLTTDQRGLGFSRIADGPDADATATVDIGAYEKQPLFPNVPDVTTNEDTAVAVAFDVDDIGSINSVTASSSNAALVPNNSANLSLTLAGSTEILTINPAADEFGMSDITVTVNRTGGSTSHTFNLTLNPVNDAPSFNKGPDQSINENDPAQTVNNWAANISPGPANESGQTLSFQVINDNNAALFAIAPAISPTGTLTYTPASHASGTATITIALMDNGGTANGGIDTSATQTFNINVLDGGSLQFSASFFSVSESGGNALITVNRIGGTAGEARVDYASSDGSAVAGQDYTATSGTLTFANGVSTQTFSVPIINDALHESNETVNLTLTNAGGSGSLGSPATASLSIVDNDPSPILSINDVQVVEGNSGTTNAVFTVTLTGATALTATVSFATANNTANFSDYQPTAGQLSFSPGETTKTITVAVIGDTINEPNETFFVNLNTPTNATLSRSTGVGTILNDDTPTLRFTALDFPIAENSASGFVTVSVVRSGDTSGAATVDYRTTDTDTFTVGCADTVNNLGSAYGRCDFATVVGTFRFAASETMKSFDVPIIDDSYHEGNETFNVVLSNPTGATLGSPSTATVTIIDNDAVDGPNPILQTDNAGVAFFVRQHYLDFLGREPEAGEPWSAILRGCADQFNIDPNSPSAACDRITVSGAFFGSPEFKDKGFFVIDFYRVAFGRLPQYSEFVTDLASLVGTTAQEVFARRAAFADSFVQRPEFAGIAALPNSSYVMTLMAGTNGQNYNLTSITTPDPNNPDGTTKVTLTTNDLINGLNASTLTKAQVLRAIGQSDQIVNIEAVSTFVASQYYGYLRRTPEAAGFNDWVNYLTTHPTNFRTMVNGFMNSQEYRLRFGML
jgi:hypothetical protein